MANSVLVTGGSGFIGGAIVRELERQSDCTVEAWDSESPEFSMSSKYQKVDITSPPLPEAAFDYIYHCAALLGAETTFGTIADTERVNVQGTLAILEHFRSGTIIRPGLMGDWLNPYMISTKTAEQYGLMYREYLNRRFVSCRFTVVYGPGQRNGIDQRKCVPMFIRQALDGATLTVYGDGSYRVRLLYIDDAVQAMIRLPVAYDQIQPVVTITSLQADNYITVKDLAEKIIRLTDSKSEIVFQDMRMGQPSDALDAGAVVEKSELLFSQIDFGEQIALDEGLARTIGWMRDEVPRNGRKVGVAICAYDRDADYLVELCKSVRDAGCYTVLAYDAASKIPNAETVNIPDLFLTGGGHLVRQPGHQRNMLRSLGALHAAGCDYSLCITGDAIIERPEGIPMLIEALGEADLMANQWNRFLGNLIVFGKTSSILSALERMSAGPPQNEKKFTRSLQKMGTNYIIRPVRANDRGVWETIGYARRHENYPPG